VKILILRFSSIGDIVLTTPVLRCIAQQVPNAEIHYATKKKFASLLEANPYIHKTHLLEDDFLGFADAIAQEKFDHIIDLHSNLRTLRLRLKVRSTWSRFNKLNLQKWLYIRLGLNFLPNVHIVDRYMATVSQLGVVYDGKGLDYHIPASVNLPDSIQEQLPEKFAVFVIGGTWTTKNFHQQKYRSGFPKYRCP
jgi:heptosyltransferase-2